MNFFKLARMYPDATTEAEAISAAEADIASLDAQISELTSKREQLTQLMGTAPNPDCATTKQMTLVEPTRQSQLHVRLGARISRIRSDGIVEYQYNNDSYSKIANQINVGTRDKNSKPYQVWLSVDELKRVYHTHLENLSKSLSRRTSKHNA